MTKNAPGVDSIYIVAADEKTVSDELVLASKVSATEKDVIERKVKRSKYVWWGDTIPRTKDGKIFTEIGRDMIEAQKFYLSTAPERCYDRITIRPLLPDDNLVIVPDIKETVKS